MKAKDLIVVAYATDSKATTEAIRDYCEYRIGEDDLIDRLWAISEGAA